MFGTNWPMLAPQKCLEGLSELGLTGAQREAFLHGDARRVLDCKARLQGMLGSAYDVTSFTSS